jgi:hypothetical protein
LLSSCLFAPLFASLSVKKRNLNRGENTGG